MYSLSNCQVCNTVLLTIVITLYITATCVHLIHGSLSPLITFTHFPQWPWKQPVYFASVSSLLKVVVRSFSRIRLFATPWTAARQASLSFTISQSLLKLISRWSRWCHPTKDESRPAYLFLLVPSSPHRVCRWASKIHTWNCSLPWWISTKPEFPWFTCIHLASIESGYIAAANNEGRKHNFCG